MESRFADGCAWIDGEYLPIEEARVPITDTGFSRSDVTYDVVAVWKGRFFRLADHLARFKKSYRGLHMKPPLSISEMRDVLFECVRRSGLRDAYVDMIATRGMPVGGNRDPRTFRNRFYAYAIPYVWIVKPEAQEKGSHLVVVENTVRIPPESVDPTIKNFHWGDFVRGIYETYERGGELAVLPAADGTLTEGPGFNLFAVRDGAIHTPARGALEGVTRRTVLELAAEDGVDTHVRGFDARFLGAADEAFVTSTAGGVMPITRLNGEALGSGVPGPVTTRLRELYWAAHEDPRFTEVVEYED